MKFRGCDFGKNPRGSFTGWLRWAVKKKMAHPENRYPENTKSRVLGFAVAAVEATWNLRGPRIEIWASIEAKPTFGT